MVMDVVALQWSQWLTLLGVFMLGAMLPGASLAVIARHGLVNGRAAGLSAAVAHGLGIGIYSGLAVFSIGVVMLNWPGAIIAVQVAGAFFLLYLAWQALRSAWGTEAATVEPGLRGTHHAWRDGFLIAFLNPKVGVFFIAVFSQFLEPGHSVTTKALIALLAGAVDTLWYILVVLLLSTAVARARYLALRRWLEAAFALLLILVASQILWVGSQYVLAKVF